MDEAGKNVQMFNKSVDDLVNMNVDDGAQKTTYLGFIAYFMANIADSLEKMSDHMTADPNKKAFDEYRKAREAIDTAMEALEEKIGGVA